MPELADIRLKVLLVSRRKDTLDSLDAVLRKYPGIRIERKLVVNGHVDPLHGVTSPPDALVLHLGQTWQAELESLAARPADRRPPLVVVGSTNDTNAMRLAMQAGARDLLPIPLVEADLMSALARIERDRKAVSSGEEGAVTAFINAKGGCGSTFLACNVAHVLAAQSQQRVALIDLDLQFGTIPLYFDLFPKRGLLQAIENLEGMDATAFQGYLARHGSGLGILGNAADDALPVGNISAEAVQTLLNVAVRSHQHVVVDLPRRIDPVTTRVIDRAQHIVLVVQQSVTVLRDATRLMNCLRRDLAVSADRITAVINRYEKDSPISTEDIRSTIGCADLLAVPNDYRSVSECIAAGRPLLEHVRTAAITKAVMALETRLGGTAATARPGLLARTFSSLIKPRSP
ncbi:MAG TPA: AAA family ATPase [Steroidobacteraceae bacterium]|nr:AAA family ATPase [Steroidobacteraceae bacterium]